MPGCKAEIHAMTGLQEISKLQQHFSKKHKIVLDMMAALKAREVMEVGEVPIRVDDPRTRV
jgi:hypothetical protein